MQRINRTEGPENQNGENITFYSNFPYLKNLPAQTRVISKQKSLKAKKPTCSSIPL